MRYGTMQGMTKPISRLVQGTAYFHRMGRLRSLALLDEVFERGCTAFDTAHQYGSGKAERWLGEWMRANGNREQVFVLSKGAHHTADRRRVTAFDITADLFDSLARLKTDYIDLYLLHRDDPSVPVGPIVEILTEHQRAGRIRAFGGSNWTHERICEANEYAQAHGLIPFAASSPQFSLAEQVKPPWRDCVSISGPQGQAARNWYAGAHMPLFVWSSFAGGFFSGRFTRDNLKSFRKEDERLCVKAYCYEHNFKRLERAQQLAAQKGLTVAQVALAYVFNQPMEVYALVGHRSGAEYHHNAVACEVELSPEEVAWLDLRIDGFTS